MKNAYGDGGHLLCAGQAITVAMPTSTY